MIVCSLPAPPARLHPARSRRKRPESEQDNSRKYLGKKLRRTPPAGETLTRSGNGQADEQSRSESPASISRWRGAASHAIEAAPRALTPPVNGGRRGGRPGEVCPRRHAGAARRQTTESGARKGKARKARQGRSYLSRRRAACASVGISDGGVVLHGAAAASCGKCPVVMTRSGAIVNSPKMCPGRLSNGPRGCCCCCRRRRRRGERRRCLASSVEFLTAEP